MEILQLASLLHEYQKFIESSFNIALSKLNLCDSMHFSQVMLLDKIARTGNMCARNTFDRNNNTYNLDVLFKLGLIERSDKKGLDKRRVYFVLTDLGNTIITNTKKEMNSIFKNAFIDNLIEQLKELKTSNE